MGSGCSSPLKRFGGKRGKPRRESSPYGEPNGESGVGDTQDAIGDSNRQQQQRLLHSPSQNKPLILENEITIQSEMGEDHPSTASYYTDGRCHNEETKMSEHSTSLDPKSSGTTSSGALNLRGGSAAARMMGLNGTYAPHDRHLLVSPALSPAPSTCYSPSPAASSVSLGITKSIDLNDLNEAFKTLIFNSPDQTEPRIKQPERMPSELHSHYMQHLVQTKNDLINYISVVFITTDNFQFTSTSTGCQDEKGSNISQFNSNANEILASNIESNLKAFCDEHLFNLRFLNLSQEHLSEYLHINNLLEVSKNILEREYLQNSQRLILIVLSNQTVGSSTNLSNGNQTESSTAATNNTKNHLLDKRQLPTKVEAQTMHKLQSSFNSASNLDPKAKDLLKQWYNQVGNIFYLNPIYLVYPKILSELKEERDQAWQNWLEDSNTLIKSINVAQEAEHESLSEIKLKSLFSSHLEFIMREQAIQKRTLLIRNYTQPMNGNLSANQPTQQTPVQIKDGSLNELSRSLPDSNKISLKRPMSEEEFIKTINDWVSENFAKFVDGIKENQIMHGKQVPPFIDRNLFTELTCQRHHLEHYLDNITENFETKCASFYTNQISPILNSMLIAANDTPSGSDVASEDQQSTMEKQQQPSTNHLVFISGPKGCGKSTLFAQIIKLAAQEFFNKTQFIYRFCGQTLDSLSSNRLLRSICEQFCQTQGENITAASYIYSARSEIMNALNKIIKSQLSLIFLDGLDIYNESFEADLDWLCEIESNPRIKIFITLETDSNLYKKVLGSYSDATYISLDHPSIAEWAQMLTSTARSRRFNSGGNLYDEVKKLDVPDSDGFSPLTYSDISDIIRMCHIRKLNNESIFPELTAKSIQNNLSQNSKTVHQIILKHLHYFMAPYQLCALIILLGSSRNGYQESDIISIMNVILQSSKVSTYGGDNCETKFSPSLFDYIKIQLEPWLVYIFSDKTVKVSLQKDFTLRAMDHYTTTLSQNIVTEIRELLIEYFSRQTNTSRPSKSNIFKGVGVVGGGDGSSLEIKENISSSERSWLAAQASELAQLILLTSPTKARDHVIDRNKFFQRFLYGSMPEEFIEDYDRVKDVAGKKSVTNEELASLVNYIRQSVYPLRYDGSQIFSQIYCRAYDTIKAGKFSKSKKLNDILQTASCPPTKSLLPISEISVNSFIKTRIGQANSKAASKPPADGAGSQPQPAGPAGNQAAPPARQKIFTIKDNHRHVIVVFPDKGSLAVWDIYEERAVRTISNLDQPRDVKMIDHKRAVILCNRELRVYDLDSGLLLTKLKGVMNQKMPFYEVFGENYVVALARNRMYVNMLNLNTGELETTFKVGEDRFLNSLLVSANAGICVCGDETQKPFPLLVWNLNERRLMYDLRLDRHEFITRMSAISDNGHFVVSVCRQLGDGDNLSHGPASGQQQSLSQKSSSSSPNFIVIYDLNSGTLFKKWKPGLDSCAVAISLLANRSGRVINTIVDSSILVWDLATGSKRHTLIGHSAPADVIKVQNNRLFSMDSTCRDQSLRIWDIEEGYCLSVFSSEAPVNCCQMSIRGDALVCAFATETRLSTLVMCKNESVNDVVKRNKRRKSSKSLYIFDEPPSRKSSS